VPADLNDKFQNIEKCMRNDGDNCHYTTVQSSLLYETENDIHTLNHNATLSLLRLVRGLEFVCRLLDNLHVNRDNGKRTYELAALSYSETLAHRHHWAVRQLVKTGFYLLPRKVDLLKIMLRGVEGERDEQLAMYEDFLATLEKVYAAVREVYADYDFLELVLV